MSRARNIKPQFFENEDLVEMPFEYRLLFIGLWTLADREGRLEDRPKRIKMQIFPADNVDIEAALTALHGAGMVLRYTVNGNRYISIPAWKKHQNPHCREAASKIPPPSKNDGSTVQAQCEHSSSPADSLIPDSLIPDSKALGSMSVCGKNLAPARESGPEKATDRPEKPPSDPPVQANVAACIEMRQAGAIHTNPSHPQLLAGIAEGATPAMYGDAVRNAIERGKGEPFSYALTAVRGQLAEAKRAQPENPHANRSPSRKLSAVERVEAAIHERRATAARSGPAGLPLGADGSPIRQPLDVAGG